MEFLDQQTLEIFGKLALAAFLGALIGLERRLARKTAGMRTFALVALGSALFTIIPQIAFSDFTGINFDPSRIASQVVVGIGFIGAGLIIFHRSKIKGLTTAAGLWVSAAIGMSIAYGLYAIGIFATLATIFVLVILWFIEHSIFKKKETPLLSESDDEEG